MPRLEEGQLLMPARKFKKRRAWIVPEEETVTSETDSPKSIEILSVTRAEHECNKTITRVEQECNKSVTRLEQKKSRIDAIKPAEKIRLEHECNKTVTRVEQDCNKSVTRLEHEYNKSVTDADLGGLLAFVDVQRISMSSYEEGPRCLILSLSDVQKKIFWCTASECINRDTWHTGPIEIKAFFAKLDISTAVVRTTLNRLVDKRIMQREKGKLGKNGFSIISLSKIIFDAAKAIFSEFQALRSVK